MEFLIYTCLNIFFAFIMEFMFYKKDDTNNGFYYTCKVIGLGILVVFTQGSFAYFYIGMLAFVNFIVIRDLKNAQN